MEKNNKKTIYEYGKYSKLDKCPECKIDKQDSVELPAIFYPGIASALIGVGVSSVFVDETKEISQEVNSWFRYKNIDENGVVEYICNKCKFKWLEKTKVLEKKEQLEQKYQNLLNQFEEINKKNNSLKKEIINSIKNQEMTFKQKLDGEEKVDIDDIDDNLL